MVNRLEVEVIPGVTFSFTKRGITADSLNTWLPNSMRVSMGKFEELTPVKHYGEYLEDLDRRYAERGKPGLAEAIMQRSNPRGVADFDKLVDEFNVDLSRIVRERDNGAVQEFFRRSGDLKDLPADQTP